MGLRFGPSGSILSTGRRAGPVRQPSLQMASSWRRWPAGRQRTVRPTRRRPTGWASGRWTPARRCNCESPSDFQYPKTVIGRAEEVAFSPDGKLLAAGFAPGQFWDPPSGDEPPVAVVRVWDLSRGKELLALTGPHQANAVAVSPDGELLAAGGGERGHEGVIHLWNLRTGQLVRRWKADETVLFCLAFSPGGKLLASGGDEPAVKLWDVASGQLAGTLEGHSDQIHALAFARDGRILASAGRDKLVLLWQLKWK